MNLIWHPWWQLHHRIRQLLSLKLKADSVHIQIYTFIHKQWLKINYVIFSLRHQRAAIGPNSWAN